VSRWLARSAPAGRWQRLGETIELAFGGYPSGVWIRPVIAEGFAGQVLVRAARELLRR
jgi:hypothetical protein